MNISESSDSLGISLSNLESVIVDLPEEKYSSMQFAIQELKSALSCEESSRFHTTLQEKITHIKDLANEFSCADKVTSIIQKMVASERRKELLYYLFHTNEQVPISARERIRQTVEEFDQKEEIEGAILAFRLTTSEDPFLRGLFLTCLDKGADPAYITPKGTSLMKYLICSGDKSLIAELTLRLDPIGLKKVLLTTHSITKDCALQFFNTTNLSLLVDLLEKANLSFDQPIGDTSLFLYYLDKASSNQYGSERFCPFLEKWCEKADPSQLQKALSICLAMKSTAKHLIKILAAYGARPGSENEKASFSSAARKILREDFELDDDFFMFKLPKELSLKFYLSLIESENLPLSIGSSAMTIDLLPKSPLVEEAIKKVYPQKIVAEFKDSLYLVGAIKKELSRVRSDLDFIALSENIALLQKLLAEERFFQLPGFKEFKKEMELDIAILEQEIKERQNAVLEWVKEAEKAPIPILFDRAQVFFFPEERSPVSVHLSRDIVAFVVTSKKWDLLTQISKREYEGNYYRENTALFHFLLDKALNQQAHEKFHGGTSYNHAVDLIDSIEHYIPHIEQDKTIPLEKKEAVKNALNQSIKSLALLVQSEKHPEILYKAFQDGISPILVPAGYKEHAVVLALYPNGANTTALLFNTGAGIDKYHAAAPDHFQIQTFIGAHNIPTKSITKEEISTIFDTQQLTEVDPVYQHTFKMLNRGEIMGASSNPFDYEMVQLSGTCSAQCLMAFLRHHLLMELGGSTLENIGLYKVIKARTFKIMAEKRLPYIVDIVKEETGKRLQEIELQNRLWDLSLSEDKWGAVQEMVSKALMSVGLTPLVHEFPLSPSARCFILERNLRRLAKHPGIESIAVDFQELNPIFKLLTEKRAIRKERYSVKFKMAREKQDLKELRSVMAIGVRTQLFQKEWLIDDYQKDPMFWNSLPQKGPDGQKLYDLAIKISPDLYTPRN